MDTQVGNKDQNSDEDRVAEIEDITSRLDKVWLGGVSIQSEPLWVERAKEILAWLPDSLRQEITEALDRATAPDPVFDPDSFSEQHGLTPAETRLLTSLADGATVSEHAAANEISVNTARVHMQRVLEKTGARRQADLVRMLVAKKP